MFSFLAQDIWLFGIASRLPNSVYLLARESYFYVFLLRNVACGLISPKNSSRTMKLYSFSLLESSVSRCQILLPDLPELAQALIFKENCSRLMKLSRFSLLQSSASRFQLWLPELPELFQVLICGSRSMELGRVSLLQSSASGSLF